MSHSRTVRFVTLATPAALAALAALAGAGCTRGADRVPPPQESRTSVDQGAARQPSGGSSAAMTSSDREAPKGRGNVTPGTPVAPQPAAIQPVALEAMAAARKLIRTGQLTLVVESYVQAADQVKGIALSHGGYLADAQAQRGAADRRHGSLTIRVDAARFDDAMVALRALGDVRSENVSAQDVTRAYADLETRLRVKRETSDRLRAILRDRTAVLSDVLEAERELARVTEEIEQAEGERRFYDQQVALSTLTVTLQEPSAVVEASAFAPLTEAFRDSVRVLAASLAAIVYAAVFLTPWLLVAWALWKLLRRLLARRRAVAVNV